MPPKNQPVKPPINPPPLVKTRGAFSLQSAPDELKLSVFEVIKDKKGLDVPQGRNASVASEIILTLYGKGGPLVEYDKPTNQTSWLSRAKGFFKASYDALQMKAHGGSEEEEESEFERFVNKIFPKTKMGKKMKKSRAAEKDDKTVKRVLGGSESDSELESEGRTRRRRREEERERGGGRRRGRRRRRSRCRRRACRRATAICSS